MIYSFFKFKEDLMDLQDYKRLIYNNYYLLKVFVNDSDVKIWILTLVLTFLKYFLEQYIWYLIRKIVTF